ncbi:hypothetical protein FRB97_004886 [Tulasnella sp. 331]|nr:hypothetical protein FRB97_004886 [Tulasnella sp. 331]
MQTLLQPESKPSLTAADDSPDPKVYFDPPLWLQRRTWVLDQLREHQVESVIDLGCGEGALLEVLMEPASAYPAPSPSQVVGRDKETTMDIHLKHYVGLDIDSWSIAQAAEVGKPPTKAELENRSPWLNANPRWLDMNVELWEGGLQFLNGDMDFTLGVYRPQFMFLTTPNYNFNQLFSHPERPDRASGYPDPTGVTNRVFRHHDHKREWTEDEWRVWCQDGAEAWGYDVELGGLGQAEEDDPWGRKEAAGKASLTAAFRRKSLTMGSDLRCRCIQALAEARSRTVEESKHKLILRHRHLAHKWAGRPRELQVIREALREVLQDGGELGFKEGKAAIDEIWLRGDVAIACGGLIQALLDAVAAPAGDDVATWDWVLDREIGADTHVWRERFWSWGIVWRGFVKAVPKVLDVEVDAQPSSENWELSKDEPDNEADPEEWQVDPKVPDGGWTCNETAGWGGTTPWGDGEDGDTGGWNTTSWGTVDASWA